VTPVTVSSASSRRRCWPWATGHGGPRGRHLNRAARWAPEGREAARALRAGLPTAPDGSIARAWAVRGCSSGRTGSSSRR